MLLSRFDRTLRSALDSPVANLHIQINSLHIQLWALSSKSTIREEGSQGHAERWKTISAELWDAPACACGGPRAE